MSTLSTLTSQLAAGRSLGPDEVESAAAVLAAAGAGEAEKADFLAALAAKGETAGEIAAFASAFRARAVDAGVSAWAPRAIDIVGTGGDHAGGFNISSVVALVLASAGVPVMKHGNRGITSKCGSADLLAGLGVKVDAPPSLAREALRQLDFAFFFAPAYHPSFRNIAPVRRMLAQQGRRTVFNLLGPLLNPGRPSHVLAGVFSEAWVPTLADALHALGVSAGLAAHGRLGPDRGIDELTTATVNRVRGAGRLQALDAEWNGADFGFAAAPFSDLAGGDLAANLALTQSVLQGRGPVGLADTIVLNAAVGLWICGQAAEIRQAAPRARELLLGGAVRRKLEAVKEFYAFPP
ncbi:MAG: anthranilate phosphoribosyltransferase [Opitutaceae bacterium]